MKVAGSCGDAHVTTDCGAVGNLKGPPVNAPDDAHAAAMALMNGTDLEMGDTFFTSLSKAIDMGLATKERLEEAAVRRSFKVHFELGRFDPANATAWAKYGLADVNHSLHQQISYEAALQSLVLLKNDRALPIKDGLNVAVVGPHSISRNGLFSDYAVQSHCFDGTAACVPTLAEGIAAANERGNVSAALGVEINSNRTDDIPAALDLVRKSDFVVLALGDNTSIERETLDRVDTALPGLQESFAKQVLALQKPTVIVLVSGGPMAIDAILEFHARQKVAAGFAIVQAFYPSQKGAHALGKTLFGKENRWGKLPITMYPHNYISEQPMTNYDMSVAPGRTYKYYQGEPLFPFGFGLSLTSFDFRCSKGTGKPTLLEFTFLCQLQNTGTLDGEEVLQVYHSAVDIGKVDHPLPKRALRDFKRVAVAAGQKVTVDFTVSRRELELVNKAGSQTLYPGVHLLILSRGHVSWLSLI
eukprot:Skav222383  [mRNA]  locus=scaffold2692:362839:366684:- [translate_table: standard]